MKKVIVGVLLIIPASLYGFEKIPVNWSGYAALDSFYDTHEVVGFQDDILLYYAKRDVPDRSSGSDIHNSPQTNMTAIRSRLTASAQGPKIHDFATKMIIEADFFGAVIGAPSGFRLRHAYGILKNDRHEIIFGQYWHPIRSEDCTAQVVSLNGGAPLSLWARDPQIRYTYTNGRFQCIGAILEQAPWFESNGPEGYSSIYIRRAVLPNLHLQFRYATENRSFGVLGDYKQLVPRVVNDDCNSVSERVHNAAASAYFVQKLSKCDLRMQGTYAQNAVDLTTFGGYVVTSENPFSGARSYEPLQLVTFWFDINGTNQRFSPGLFTGFGKNLGINKSITFFNKEGKPIAFGQNPHVDYVVRLSPRLVWNMQQFQVALEMEYTGAAYGKFNDHAQIVHGKYVDNLRVLLAMVYYF